MYDGVEIESGFRLDMLVQELIVVENKTIEKIAPVHSAQLLTYLRLGGYELGFLLNWKVPLMKHGIYRIINPSINFIGEKDLPLKNLK